MMEARGEAAGMPDKKAVAVDRGALLIIRDLGVRPDDVLRRAQLPEDLFSRENARLSTGEYFRLWAALEAEAGDPALPLRIGQLISPEGFHPPIFAALCSPDLSTAARRLAQYKRLVAPMTLTVEDRADGLFIGMRWDEPGIQLPSSLAATELVFLTQIARIATREPIRPVRVESPHPLQPEDQYESFFGVAPVRGHAHGVTFSLADARRPFLTASEAQWDTFEPDLRRRLAELEASAPLAEKVRSVLLESLPSGESSIEVTARRLGLSSRTLQRNLREEGTSYKEVVRRTREQLARHYVTNTKLPYAEIGFLIGFEEPSSFFRAFRVWTGETPESVRFSVGEQASNLPAFWETP
jgi:AraC-like DNA-binding protein